MSSSSFNTALVYEYKRALDQMAHSSKAVKTPRSQALPPPTPETLAAVLNIGSLAIEWLAGDGSDRCYYRLRSPDLARPLVLMQLSGQDAEALREDGYDWIKIAHILSAHHICVPRVIATIPENAALVIEDYGDLMLEGLIYALAAQNDYAAVQVAYGQCFDILARFLTIPKDDDATWCKRSFDTERFIWELNFFVQKYAVPVAGLTMTPGETRQFNNDVTALADALAANSKYFVHRDFHSRNVMVKDPNYAIIDFQDARLGPAAYDLVSLCFDSYVPLTSQTRSSLMQAGIDTIAGQCGESVRQDLEMLWKPTLLQRQLKAIGSFSFLTHDKKRGDYLKYVEPALSTLEDQSLADARWPFLSGELLERLRSHLDQKSQ